MDNKIVLMVIVAIVLGMLVANMFKDVCGCKVVEGQCTVLDSTCNWTSAAGEVVSISGVGLMTT